MLHMRNQRVTRALLTDPEDTRDPCQFFRPKRPRRVVCVDGEQLNFGFGATAQDLGHDFTLSRLGDNPVTTTHLRSWRHNNTVTFTISWFHAVTANLQGI